METESSRRPFVRSREPDLKKPRLSQDPILAVDRSSNVRPTFVQRPATSGSAVSRRLSDRGGDSENSYSARGPYPQQHLELVNEYKTALAELTFNSKPIITNLTIIAGENLDAAKAITVTICSHIIEVSSEQKLPCLYLLDSIVKNIGRDYIKYFGSKLPEVFCKAYKHVDPSLHTSMKHLFGTWKGVFPPQPLQAIEKELGFAAASNRLPLGTSRPGVSVSRPANSIHVNPKYLEARQRLQQSSKAKTVGNDPSENVVSSSGHEKTSLGPGRPWADSSTKQNSQYTQGELSNVLRTKNISPPIGDSEYDSDINQSANDRGTVSSVQRNGFDQKNGLKNYNLNSKRPSNHGLTSQSAIQTTDNWKNSEEEEFMWDDINSRAGDHDHVAISIRDRWSLDDSEKMSEASVDYLSTEIKDETAFRNRALSPWSESCLPERLGSGAGRTIPGLSDSHPIYSGGLSTSTGTNQRTSSQLKVALGSIGSSRYGTSNNSPTVGSTVSVVPQRQTHGSSSPSAQSLLYPTDSSSFAGRGVHTEQALPLPSPDSKRMMSPNAPSSFSVTPHLKQHTCFNLELESENSVSDQVPKKTLNSFSHPLLSSGESSANSLLATVSTNSLLATVSTNSLLSSLVAKGLISTTKTVSTSYTPQTPSQPQNHDLETTRSGSSKVSMTLASNTTSEPSSGKPEDMTSHIGFHFKGDVLRVLHSAVISHLFDDLLYKCEVCEARLKIQDQVDRHLEWHTLRNSKKAASRLWYEDSVNTLTIDTGIEPSGLEEGGLMKRVDYSEPMVVGDESQCLCILCGELFEDFYDERIGQWMFKGAVCANVSEVVAAQGSIVHEKCISKG